MGNPITHFEVTGKDPAKLKAFYGGVFGWELHDMSSGGMEYTMVHPGSGIEGGIGGDPNGGNGHLTWYVEVDDPTTYLQKVEAQGGKTVMPAMDVPGGPMIAMFTDPEGHLVGLIKSSQG